jgi:hypothetical protein
MRPAFDISFTWPVSDSKTWRYEPSLSLLFSLLAGSHDASTNSCALNVLLSRVGLRVSKYELELRAPFGTSHSSTSRRENALIEVWAEVPQQSGGTAAVTVGVGEVGLPPKKPAAGYLSDFADVERYVRAFAATVSLRSIISILLVCCCVFVVVS